MGRRNGFVLYQESWPLIERLSMEKRGTLLTAVYAYDSGEDLPEMDDMTMLVFLEIKGKMDRSAESYEKLVETRRMAGKAGAKSRWNDGKNDKAITCHKENGKNSKAISKMANDGKNGYTETETETETEIKENYPSDSKRKGQKKAKSFAELFADSPQLNQDFVEEAWESWLEVRRELPWTEKASTLSANSLKRFSRGDPIRAVKILETAVERGWRGLYDLDDKPKPKGRTLDWDSVKV